MDRTGQQRVTVPENLRALYAPVAQQLDEVEDLLRRELSSDNPFVDRLVKHGFRLGGKRLRPALVLLSAQACGGIRPEHLTLAAMAELIHTATLVHDDVLDEATIRRHLDTINARWDNEASILLGDYLFARAMCLASSLDDAFACRVDQRVGPQDVRGRVAADREPRQLRPDRVRLLRDHRRQDGRADGLLLPAGRALRRGRAGRLRRPGPLRPRPRHRLPDRRRRARPVGRRGRRGQVAGHRPGEAEGHAAADSAAATRSAPRTASNWCRSSPAPDNHHRDALRPWFERYDAISYAREKAQWFTQRAGGELASLPATPACDSLRGLTDFVVTRHQ